MNETTPATETETLHPRTKDDEILDPSILERQKARRAETALAELTEILLSNDHTDLSDEMMIACAKRADRASLEATGETEKRLLRLNVLFQALRTVR